MPTNENRTSVSTDDLRFDQLEAIVDGSECDDQSAESVVDIAEIAQTEIGNIVFEIRTSLNDQGKEALMRTKEKLATLGSLLNCMRNNKDALSRPSEGDDEDEEILERGIRRLCECYVRQVRSHPDSILILIAQTNYYRFSGAIVSACNGSARQTGTSLIRFQT